MRFAELFNPRRARARLDAERRAEIARLEAEAAAFEKLTEHAGFFIPRLAEEAARRRGLVAAKKVMMSFEQEWNA